MGFVPFRIDERICRSSREERNMDVVRGRAGQVDGDGLIWSADSLPAERTSTVSPATWRNQPAASWERPDPKSAPRCVAPVRKTAGSGGYGDEVMRSAWIKWARAVEHQRVLARRTREFVGVDSYEYVRFDNASDGTDPLLRMHWRISIKQPYPEQWSVLLGDVLTNLRAALDHVFWAAVVAHSGPPVRPHRVQFPIMTAAAKFGQAAAELQQLVAPNVWELVESLQPFHGAARAHTAPLEILRWLCNVDKHRSVHVGGRPAFDLAPVIVESVVPLEIVEERRHEGPVEDNTVVARLKLKRPVGSTPVELRPTFAYLPTLQISDHPVEYRSLGSIMEVLRDEVLRVVTCTTVLIGEPLPEADGLELGEEHETVAAACGGNIGVMRGDDGTVRAVPLEPPAA
jgi:hypothetical protein